MWQSGPPFLVHQSGPPLGLSCVKVDPLGDGVAKGVAERVERWIPPQPLVYQSGPPPQNFLGFALKGGSTLPHDHGRWGRGVPDDPGSVGPPRGATLRSTNNHEPSRTSNHEPLRIKQPRSFFTAQQPRTFFQLNNTSCAHQDCSRGASNVGGEPPKHMLK